MTAPTSGNNPPTPPTPPPPQPQAQTSQNRGRMRRGASSIQNPEASSSTPVRRPRTRAFGVCTGTGGIGRCVRIIFRRIGIVRSFGLISARWTRGRKGRCLGGGRGERRRSEGGDGLRGLELLGVFERWGDGRAWAWYVGFCWAWPWLRRAHV